MKTKIAAALVTLACVASIGFPAAAADDASAARTQSAATATPVQLLPETSGQFAILSDVRADALSSQELDSTRGAYVGVAYVNYTFVARQGGGSIMCEWELFFDGSAIGHCTDRKSPYETGPTARGEPLRLLPV